MTRAEEAKRLVDEGRVTIIRHNSMFSEAHIAGDNRDYVTFLFSSGNHFCLCEGHCEQVHAPSLCAHALAVRLALERVDDLRALHSSRKVDDD